MTTLSEVSNTDFCKTAKWAFERAADDASAMVGRNEGVAADIWKSAVNGKGRNLSNYD